MNLVFYGLVAVNVLLYAFLIFGYFRTRRIFIMPNVQNAIEAFAFLEKSFKRSFPEVQEGFTWSEAISRAKQLPLDINWEKVEKGLTAYESYRYGGNDRQKFDTYEILKLGIFLRGNIRRKNKKQKKQETQKTPNLPVEARFR